jgi:hypothetical protein
MGLLLSGFILVVGCDQIWKQAIIHSSPLQVVAYGVQQTDIR